MATLNSPGVSVSIINESFYTPAAPGTVPLIVVATGANKQNASGTGTAPGTTSAYAGKVWTITSQRDLTDTFGTPKFYRDANNNPIHGSELNEYGLQAAYSLLGVSSRAYVLRADVDLSQLVAQSSSPAGPPASASYWLDSSNTKFGIFEWNNSTGAFTNKVPTVVDSSNASLYTTNGDGVTLKSSFGAVGSYAVTADAGNTNAVFYKNADGNWVKVGSAGETSFASNTNNSTFVSTTWQTSNPAVVGTVADPTFLSAAGSVSINGNSITVSTASTAISIATSINSALHTSGVGAKVNSQLKVEIYVDANPGHVTITGTAATLNALGITAGTYTNPELTIAPHTQYPDYTTQPTGSVYIKTTSPNTGAYWTVKQYSGTAQAFNQVASPIYGTPEDAIYALDKTGGTKIAVGTLFVQSNFNAGSSASTSSSLVSLGEFRVQRRSAVAPTTITSTAGGSTPVLPNGAVLTVKESLAGEYLLSDAKSITLSGTTVEALATQINSAGFTNVSAAINANGTITISHKLGGEILFNDPGNILTAAGFTAYSYNAGTDVWAGTENLYSAGSHNVDGYDYRASNWQPLVYTASAHSPTTDPVDGTLWYSSVLNEVDVLYHNGSTWIGYGNAFPQTDPAGPIVAASEPTAQSDGTALVTGDIWIASGDTDQYGQVFYVYNGTTLRWEQQDPTDQTSPNGWVFADARWATNGYSMEPATIAALRSSNYVDPDAPDPALYPRGTRLWNLRRSGFNVKKFVMNHIDVYSNNGQNPRYAEPMDGSNSTTPYSPDRWVTVSPNNANGSGSFGRHAQRSFVVSALKSAIDTNQTIRDTDTLIFNLIACPGYPEAIANMVSLNTDRAQTAFVIGDTPFRLEANGSALTAWGANSAHATDNNDEGAVTYNEYMAMFYPSGYTNDNLGNYIVVPPSHMMLRTFITSDQKSYQWFAPAGARRGVVDNATSVGYINQSGEFTPAALPQGLRDVLAQTGKINPIATLNGAGIMNFGNYTRANAASSLDRINVARLVAYLRRQLDVLVRPFLFEPNDQLTRNEAKNAVESFLLELVGQRALYDFIVVCDTSNNTPARIDRSELWIDIAVEPVKAVEFIYIPVRLLNTGAIKSGNFGKVTNG